MVRVWGEVRSYFIFFRLGTTRTSSMSQETTARASALLQLLAGKEERTIADKIADSDRPTWEEFKKENKDVLEASDGKEMEAYRRELDADRERRMGGGREKKSKKKRKKRSKKKRKRASLSSSDSDSTSDDDEKDDDDVANQERKRKHKKKKRKKQRKQSKKSQSSTSSEADSKGEDGE